MVFVSVPLCSTMSRGSFTRTSGWCCGSIWAPCWVHATSWAYGWACVILWAHLHPWSRPKRSIRKLWPTSFFHRHMESTQRRCRWNYKNNERCKRLALRLASSLPVHPSNHVEVHRRTSERLGVTESNVSTGRYWCWATRKQALSQTEGTRYECCCSLRTNRYHYLFALLGVFILSVVWRDKIFSLDTRLTRVSF